MKTIYTFLFVAALVPGLIAQPAPGNPPSAENEARDQAMRQALQRSLAQVTTPQAAAKVPVVVPAKATATNSSATPLPTNAVVALTNNAATPLTDSTAPPTRTLRAAAAETSTNAAATRPAFPTLPTPPTPRRSAPTPPANTAIPAGGGAVPPNNNVLGAPAAATPGGTAAAPGNGAAATNLDEEVLPPGLIKFQDTALLQVLEIYQDLTGRTIVRPTSLPDTKISVKSQTPLTRKEAIQLLDTILAMNGIVMIPQGAKVVKALPEAQAPQAAAEFLPEDVELDNTTRYVTKVIRLKNALPRDVGPILQQVSKLPNSILAIDASNLLVIRDYEENIKRMEELLQEIDVVPNNEFEPVVIPIKYALASDIAQVLSSLTAGGGGATTVGANRPSTGLSSTPGFQGRGGIGGGGGLGGMNAYGANNQLGQQGYNNQFGGSAAAGGAAGAPRSSFQNRLQAIVARASNAAGDIVVLGQTKIIADERTNALLVFATKGDVETITNIIAKLDVVLAQVLIEAIIMEVSLDDSLRYGISYLQKKAAGNNDFSGIGGINNGTFLNAANFGAVGSNAVSSLPSGFSYFSKFGDFEATATAVATDNRINVLSRPRIQTSHAVEANLFVGETRPYITGTYSYYGGGGPSSQYSQLQIGITLSVLPLINADGLVVMDIKQKIQSIGGTTKIDNNEIPITIDREANAKVAVQDGETVILGGFISTDKSKSASGVPILKDIPILGNFFRSTSKDMHRKELMVLIRPTVLPTPQIAALVARREKSKMPGISAAERDNNRIERRQQKKLNAEEMKEEKAFDNEERRDQKKLGRKQQKNMDNDLYKREGFSN